MIHIITSRNRGFYKPELDQHFRLRHDIYVVERKWRDLAKPDRLERDQFDNDDAIYLLAIDGRTVVGGSRLVPSTKPHLLSEVFPHLAQCGVPRAPSVYEWTRVHVAKDRREGRNRGRVLGSIFCGILEYCLAEGISSMTALVEMWWLPHFHEMGWTLRPLGLPELIEGEWSIAIELQVDERTLASTRTMFGIAKSTIVDTKIEQPTIHRVLA